MAGTKGRSARGEIVDFDVLGIKAKLESTDKPVEVQEREDFIVAKSKRRRSPVKKEGETEVVEETITSAGAGSDTGTEVGK